MRRRSKVPFRMSYNKSKRLKVKHRFWFFTALSAVVLLLLICRFVDTEKEITEAPQRKEENINLSSEWLLLVNSEYPLPDDYAVSLRKVQNQHQVDEGIADFVLAMLEDAKKDGIDLLICSSYRSITRQQELFNQEVDKYITAGKSNDEALLEAASGVAAPGHSEHSTGLALDIVTPMHQVLDFGFEETEAFHWLDKNAHKYGFILRYPKDKTQVTKIKYEPWHYRFVGPRHAQAIKEQNLTLEEYLSDGVNLNNRIE